MKIIILLLLTSFGVSPLFAQTEQQPQDTAQYSYAEIVGTQRFLSNKVTIVVDYGQQRKFFSDMRVRDANGDVQKFNSMVDALNYMGKDGWEFVQAYVVTIGSGLTGENVYHWLLKRPMVAALYSDK